MASHIASPSAQSSQWMRTRLLIEKAESLGCSRQQALVGTRIGLDMLETPGSVFTIPDQVRVMINTARALPDSSLGILWGETLNAFSRERIGLWLSAHPTLGAMLDAMLHYQELLSSPVRGKGIRGEHTFRFELHYPPGTDATASLIRLNNECMMASQLQTMRQLVEAPLHPVNVSFSHPEPNDKTHYHRVFGNDFAFNAPHTSLTFNLVDLDRPISSHNPAIERFYLQETEKEFQAHMAQQNLTTQVKTHLLQLSDQQHTAASVAKALGCSERTLRRRLEQEKTSFRDIQHQVLLDNARGLLQTPGMTVQAAARQLGFSDVSNFRRALKRLTGLSPSKLR